MASEEQVCGCGVRVETWQSSDGWFGARCLNHFRCGANVRACFPSRDAALKAFRLATRADVVAGLQAEVSKLELICMNAGLMDDV
jgi:hypothetical protein